MDDLTPKDYGETVALFRHGLIGELAIRASLLDHGQRSEELRRLSAQRVRPPGSETTRCYSVATLERWLYVFKKGGLAALTPRDPRTHSAARSRPACPRPRSAVPSARRSTSPPRA